MKGIFSVFPVLLLCGCTYTDVYVHEETDSIRKKWFTEPEYIHELLDDVDLIIFPNFREFQPGYENPSGQLGVISKDPVAIRFKDAKFANPDTGFRYEKIMNESLETREIEGFAGAGLWNYYVGGIALIGKENYSDFYGASEIEITISYSVNGNFDESMTFKLARISKGYFILVQ